MTSAPSLRRRVRAVARSSASEAILDAAERAFAADGIAGTGMQAIAHAAGTSVGTLYNYFADKDALIRALFEERHRRLGDSIDAVLVDNKAAPFRTQLTALVHAVLVHFDTHRAFLKVALAADQTPLTKKRSAMLVLQERVGGVIEAGVAEGALEPRLAPLASTALSGILRAVLLRGIEEHARFEDLVDDVVELFLNGASGRRERGRK